MLNLLGMQKAAAMGAIAGGSLLSGAAVMAYAVRGRSSQLFGRSVFRGPRNRRAIAITFDDGPSESTPGILEILHRYQAPATFFQCGANIRRLPEIARHVLAEGHEIGNHSDKHLPLYLQSPRLIYSEFAQAQQTIHDTLGVKASYLRAPFGARWFGFREMQQRLGLMGVMWSIIGKDWVLDAAGIARRVLSHAANGSIICLHDGRELSPKPNIETTLEAVRRIVPDLLGRGFEFLTVSDLLCPTN
jgi:peptidoglycan/xylan/chitin deacetylase (PgdA/CDA1 family)